MALETTQPADHVLGPERSTQQPKTVQSLDPLAVLDVSLTSRDVAQMPSIDQKHFDAGRFQLLVERYPVDPVDSIATVVTPQSFNHSTKASNPSVKALKQRTTGSPSSTDSGDTAA